MTTFAEIKRLVQPLLAGNTDLALIGRYVYVVPVRHVMKYVLIDRTSSKELFDLKWILKPAFDWNVEGFIWTHDIYPPKGFGNWLLTTPNVSSALCEQIEAVGLPLLRAAGDIADLVHVVNTTTTSSHTNFHTRPIDRVLVEIALGQLEAAEETCAIIRSRPGHYSSWKGEPFPSYTRIVNIIEPMVRARDRAGLARLLRAQEAENVAKLKIEKYWTPSPFPIEG